MKTTNSTTLPDDIESLKALVLSLQGESKKYQQLYYETLEKWQLSLKQRFAASSEGYPGQGELFNEAEELLAPSEEEIAADETITYTRKKNRRQSLAAELPREDVVHEIPEADKVCSDCGTDLHRMGEEVSEKLEFIPATVKVIRHIRPKDSCRCCEKNATQTQINVAPVPVIFCLRASPHQPCWHKSSALSTSLACPYTAKKHCSKALVSSCIDKP